MQASSEALKAKCLLAFFSLYAHFKSESSVRLLKHNIIRALITLAIKKTQKNLVRIYFFHNFAEPLAQINQYTSHTIIYIIIYI